MRTFLHRLLGLARARGFDAAGVKAPPGQASIVKGWITERLKLSDVDLVSLAELACHEPGCPPIETVVTVHGADGQRRTWRLHKPVAEITAADVESLEAQP